MPSPRFIHSFARHSVASLLAALAVGASLAVAIPARADNPGWPRQFDSTSGSFVIYQPQPEDLNGDVLTGRAAFSLQKSEDLNPTFGVLWYTERIEIDRDSSTVWARSLDVTKVRLPRITPDEATRYEALVEDQAAGWDLSGSLEELQAGLAAAEKERASVAGLKNTPPRILFHDRRAILVVYDGAPVLEPMERSTLQRAVNTPYAVVFDPRNRSYYLNGANLWYRAKDPLGPWTDIPAPPAAIREIVPPDTSSYDQVEGPPPEVLTATEPTELIATDGAPRYAPLVDDELLYITNTESDVVLEVSTQHLYVLISGRWFRAPSMDGPWTFVRGDELPVSFKDVPLDSPKGNILASVADTDQAEDAITDAEIPQTSAIQRSDQSFNATYDGDPQFEPIEGTDLQYAVNTDAEVILADGRYYACDQGVWYISDAPYGPWSVSDTRPVGVEDIPPSCPVYDVRYVYIYDSTPEVVYVGYLPGYLGCYPYYGTVVYGTGHRYGAWRSRHQYYPLVDKDMTLLRTRRPGRTRPRLSDGLPANMYNRPENVARVDRSFDRIRTSSIARPIARPAPVPDDVFAGKDGRVYRREPRGTWQVRTGTAWKPTNLPTPTPPTPSPRGIEPASPSPTEPFEREVIRQRKGPAIERRVPQRDNPRERPTPPPEQPAPPAERPTPPAEKPTPGDLEREYRARQRSDRGDNPGAEPPTARPTPPQRSKENDKPYRGR